jgi:hypothetical protein
VAYDQRYRGRSHRFREGHRLEVLRTARPVADSQAARQLGVDFCQRAREAGGEVRLARRGLSEAGGLHAERANQAGHRYTWYVAAEDVNGQSRAERPLESARLAWLEIIEHSEVSELRPQRAAQRIRRPAGAHPLQPDLDHLRREPGEPRQ